MAIQKVSESEFVAHLTKLLHNEVQEPCSFHFNEEAWEFSEDGGEEYLGRRNFFSWHFEEKVEEDMQEEHGYLPYFIGYRTMTSTRTDVYKAEDIIAILEWLPTAIETYKNSNPEYFIGKKERMHSEGRPQY